MPGGMQKIFVGGISDPMNKYVSVFLIIVCIAIMGCNKQKHETASSRGQIDSDTNCLSLCADYKGNDFKFCMKRCDNEMKPAQQQDLSLKNNTSKNDIQQDATHNPPLEDVYDKLVLWKGDTECTRYQQETLRQMLSVVIHESMRESDPGLYDGEGYCDLLSPDGWKIIRNSVFAKHGRPFDNEMLQNFFYDDNGHLFKINPEYNDRLLSEMDKDNLKLIIEMEAPK